MPLNAGVAGENCCATRFWHHTLLEFAYLSLGLESLSRELGREMAERARESLSKNAESDETGMPVKTMCPLNADGICILYRFRPMICRLHGIPHEFVTPDKKNVKSPGCAEFHDRHGRESHLSLDRTEHYIALANLEKKLRFETGIRDKIRMTVTEMILNRPTIKEVGT